jgi:hypothetical protein
VHTHENKDTLVAIKHTVKEFKYIKDFQSYRHIDDNTIPQRPATDVFPFTESQPDNHLLQQQPKEI